MHKPKDNSRYGDEIRVGERRGGAGQGCETKGAGLAGAKNSYLKMYLPSGSQESPSAWKVRFLPFCFVAVCVCVRTRAWVRACVCGCAAESAYRFIRGDVETVGGNAVRGYARRPTTSTRRSDLRVCARVRVERRTSVTRAAPSSVCRAFPCSSVCYNAMKAFRIDAKARRFVDRSGWNEGDDDNPRCDRDGYGESESSARAKRTIRLDVISIIIVTVLHYGNPVDIPRPVESPPVDRELSNCRPIVELCIR